MSSNSPSSDSSIRWLYIDFNSYFASVEQQLDPGLRDKPVAVVPVETDATCVIAASYEAKAFGIKTGTPVWEAKKLCPELICVMAQHEKYVQYHHLILKEVDRHLPIAAVCSIDEVACRLMDNELSRVTEIALSIKQGLKINVGEYVRCSIGIAPNRYLAKVATDLQKPDGLTILTTADLPKRLYELKLRDLPGIGRNMERRLARYEITDMKILWNCEPKHLRKAWGSIWGERMWYFLRGVELPEEKATVRRTIGHSHVMAPDLREPELSIHVARRLTLKVASRLRRMGYYAGSFSLSARTENGVRLKEVMRCYRAQDSLTFLYMLDKIWQNLVKKMLGHRIKKVSVKLCELVSADAIQPELFEVLPDVDLRKRTKSEQLSYTLDKINHRFGKDSVLIGMLPSQGRSFSGTKIAFTRIPDVKEFLE